jgi:lipopolysaccharide/colanic/teichoic acid biosynthesis glycosyltransferase
VSAIRRGADLAGAVAGLVFFAPIMVAVAVAILLDDGAPVLFRQPRLGRGRRPFMILKFRSMRDGEVTRAGRLVRATGLDELPQFLNILRGDMSAVGPRPLTADDVRRFGWDDPAFDDRWTCRPGLTGLAQIAGADSADEALAMDRAWLARRSFWRDGRLVALSFAVNAFGKARLQRWLRARRVAL